MRWKVGQCGEEGEQKINEREPALGLRKKARVNERVREEEEAEEERGVGAGRGCGA